jgi:sugar lactone lactonase YvrE
MKPFTLFSASSCLFVSAILAGCGGSSSNSGGTTQQTTPPPTVSSISPTTAVAGSAALTLTVTGTGFVTTTTVQVGGVADATSYVSATEVTATVTPQQLTSGAQLSVIALNGTASSGSGAAVNLEVTNPVPAITQTIPATVMLGAVSPVVSVAGTGFVPTTVIDVNGSARTTIFVSATQVDVALTAADVAATGSLSLTAVNATPGGGTSTAAAVAVNNPPPGSFKLSPSVVLTGTATPTTITVTGTNFIPASTVVLGGANSTLVNWPTNGVAVATTYVSSTQLTFQLTAAEEATSQQLLVTVVNPAPGGGTAGIGILNILPQTATPVITSVSPTQFYVGSGATTVTIYGNNLFAEITTGLNSGEIFPNTSSVLWNGTALTIQELGTGSGSGDGGVITTSGDSGVFTYSGSASSRVQASRPRSLDTAIPSSGPEFVVATVPASLLASAGTATITVSNSTSTPALSNAVTVTIANPPVPTLTSLSPNSGLVNTVATVALYGTGFTTSSTVLLNGTSIATTYQNPTELMATIPASSIATPGTVNLAVTTPAPGGGTSAALPFTAYNPPPPTLTSIYPNSGPINTAAAVTLNGTGFTASSTVALNGTNIAATYVSATELTVALPASSTALPGNLNFTVTTPAPGGGTTAPMPYTVYIALVNNDMVYNPVDGLLYVSVPGSAGSPLGNSVAGIDPVTGNIMRQIWVGSNPNKIALSSDGTQLFVGLDGAGAVVQINLTTGQAVNQFPLGGGSGIYNPPYTATYLAAVPGEPNSVAVAANGSYLGGADITIYDSGVARANTSSSIGFGNGALAFGSSSSTLYMAGSSAVYKMTLGSTGITGGSSLYSYNYSYSANNIQYDNGRLYLSNGVVLDAASGSQLGTFYESSVTPANGPVVSDSTLGLAFIGESSTFSGNSEVLAFNEGTFNASGIILIGNANGGTFEKIVRWGQNGVALNTSTQIFVFQSPVVKDISSSPADVSVTLGSPATASTGTAITYTATVANAGPNQAQGVTVALTLDASLIVNSITSSQGSCGSGSAFSCDLGSLANGADATVTVSATPTTSGTIESTAMADSVSYDSNSANNQATASTTVTGNAYSAVPSVSAITPAIVQAGSGSFTLTVTGSGFSANSTVNLNGTAQSTTYVSATQLAASVEGSAIANYGWAPVTVSNPLPGGGTSQVVPLTIYAVVNVPANGILFDPYSQNLYATVPSAATSLTGNTIVAINPFTASVGTPIAIGSGPNVMAETSDGNYLYVGLSGANSLAQFNLSRQTLVATYPLSISQNGSTSSVAATWLSAMPGVDTTLAIDTGEIGGGVGIFDITGSAGAFRPNLSQIYTGNFPTFANASELYTFDNYTSGAEFYRFSVGASGLTEIDGSTLNGLCCGQFELANGIVYGANGGIVNPSTTPPTQIATLPPIDFYQSGITDSGVAVVADASTQKDFLMLENAAGTWEYALARYNTTTYLPETWVTMPASASSIETAWTMLRFGQDGLALLSSANTEINSQAISQILLLQGPFVTPQLLTTNSAANLTSSSAASIAHGAGNTLLMLTGSKFLPGVAVTWNGSYRTTTIVDATHVTVAIPASDLASTGSGSLVATNPGAPASNALTVTIN